jgi:DNA polymerase-3 subunit alpha
MLDHAGRHQEQEASGQAGLFDSLGDTKDPVLPAAPEWKESQLLAFEKESVGFYISGHPLAAYEADLKRYASDTTETLAQETARDGQKVTICGIVADLKQKMTRKNEKMAIVTLEDLSGTVEVIVFPELYKSAGSLLLTDEPLLVGGILDKSEQGAKIKTERIARLTDVKKKSTTRMDIRLNATGLTREDLLKVKEILLRHRGDVPVYLRLKNPSRSESLISVGRDIRVTPSDGLIAEIESVLGPDAVSLS